MTRSESLWPKVFIDFLAWLAAFLLAMQSLPTLESWADTYYVMPPWSEVAPWVIGSFPILAVIMVLSDLYAIPKYSTPFMTLRGLGASAGVYSVLLLAGRLMFPGPLAPPLRSALLTCFYAVLIYWLLRTGIPRFYGKPGHRRRALLVGAHTFAIRALKRFVRENPDEMEIIGFIDDFKRPGYFESLEVPFFGSQRDLDRVVGAHQPDTIVVVHDQSEYADAVIKIIDRHSCVEEIYVRAQIPLFMAQDIDILFVQEVPLLKVYSRAASSQNLVLRAIFDRVLAAIGLILTAPIFLVFPILIKLESRGPVFYRQKRLGRKNAPYWIFKFRSMVADAETKSGAVLAQKDDPRVTRVGRFMRATRVDEVPQLINVLRGEMAMIGPRPERPEFQNAYLEYIPWYPLRGLCKPGMTGLAQVNGDYHTSTERKLLYDVSYLANMSPLLDLRILLATVVTVLTKQGH